MELETVLTVNVSCWLYTSRGKGAAWDSRGQRGGWVREKEVLYGRGEGTEVGFYRLVPWLAA